MTEPMLAVRNLRKRFPIRGGLFGRAKAYVDAVADVSFDVFPSQTLGLVGESGCGKSTTARAALRLIEPDSGSIMFDGRELMGMSHQDMRQVRKTAQIVFQDPYASLNPRWQINETVGEGMVVHGFPKDEIADRVAELLTLVGLRSEHGNRYPHEFSGGQRQRIAIARAMLKNPPLLLLDEATSALDAESERMVQAALESAMKDRTTLVIAHRLATVQRADRIVVMEAGRIVESGTHAQLSDAGGLYARLAALQFDQDQD